MCSTPRCSAKPHSTHRLSESASEHKSYSQMMRTASQRYEQRQEEIKTLREERAEQENDSVDEQGTDMVFVLLNEDKLSEVKEPEPGMFLRLILKLFSFVEKKPTRIYNEYQ